MKATRKYCNASLQSSRKARLSVVATSQTNGSSHRDITSSLGMKWLSYVCAKNSISIDVTIMQHSKDGAVKRPDIPLSTKKLVTEFFNCENISRIVPNKNRTINTKIDGKKIKCPLRVMEKILNQAYAMFKSEFCNLKIEKTTFQTLRPINVYLKSAAKRLMCCCLYHQNIEYLQKAVAPILRINKRDTINFDNNENMCKFLLCDDKSILCIHQICETNEHVCLFPS